VYGNDDAVGDATATSTTTAAACRPGGQATHQMYAIESLQAILFRAVCDGGRRIAARQNETLKQMIKSY
jgi:hypothetical protein